MRMKGGLYRALVTVQDPKQAEEYAIEDEEPLEVLLKSPELLRVLGGLNLSSEVCDEAERLASVASLIQEYTRDAVVEKRVTDLRIAEDNERVNAGTAAKREKKFNFQKIFSEDVEELYHVPAKRIWAFNKTEVGWAVSGVIFAAANGWVFPIWGIFFAQMLGIYFNRDPNKLRQETAKWAGVFISVAVASFVFSTLQFGSFGVVGQKMIRRVRTLLFDRLLHMEVGFHDNPKHTPGFL
eukprot:Platyproteum_vivax@DN7743_c0_g1_i1.p1